ncbi:MAG TPA: hypothetical protein VGE62_03605 [Candidatus Paceibacterota bacterium]
MKSNFLDRAKNIRLIRNNPDRDWAVLFTLLLILVVCALAWSVYFFFGIVRDIEEVQAYKDTKVQNNLDGTEAELKNIIDTYEKRKAEGQKLKGSYPVLGDPSVF